MICGRVRIASTREIILPHIKKTETLFERTRGLLGRRRLEEGHGLLITPCNSIHTFFMKIPIDVLFLDNDNSIIAMHHDLRPFTIRMSVSASSVLELTAGQIHRLNLKENDQLLWEPAQ